MHFATASNVTIFVNGRPVQDRSLLFGVRDAYRTFLPERTYPGAVIFLKLPPEEFDINVHPSKEEVRFSSGRWLQQCVKLTLRNHLAAVKGFAPLSISSTPAPPPARAEVVSATASSEPNASEMWEIVTAVTGEPEAALEKEVSRPVAATLFDSDEANYFRSLHYIGQFAGRYLLFEKESDLILLDQHAAHERVRFYELHCGLTGEPLESQQLLSPEKIEVADALAWCTTWSKTARQMGFVVEVASQDAITLSSTPTLYRDAGVSVFKSFVGETVENEGADFTEHTNKILERLACHSSIRFYRRMGELEVRQLLVKLAQADGSSTCPHGRPVTHVLSLQDLSAIFARS